MQTAICLLLVVFFLLMNAFFVIAEFALVRVRKSQIDMAVAEKRRGAEAARDVTTHINAYLSACQLGITLASLAIGWLGEPAVSAVLEAPLLSWGFPEATVYPICVAVGFFIVTTLHVVVGELIPKSFAIFATEKYALHTAGPLRVFQKIASPLVSFTTRPMSTRCTPARRSSCLLTSPRKAASSIRSRTSSSTTFSTWATRTLRAS